jgi:hypothetical protein
MWNPAQRAVLTAVEASLYEAPMEWGLAADEIVEAGKVVGLHEGELRDAIHYELQAGHLEHSNDRLRRIRLTSQVVHLLGLMDFYVAREPERRDSDAFQFIFDFYGDRARKLGSAKAVATRTELAANGSAAGLNVNAVEVAVEVLLLGGVLRWHGDGVLAFARSWASPKD